MSEKKKKEEMKKKGKKKKEWDEGIKQSWCERENTKEEEEEKKTRKETEESTWATEDWRDVGTLEMRRRRSGQMRWEVNSVDHVRGLENGKS